MLTHHRKPVSLSVVSTDLPLWSLVETGATLYQKDRDRFHVLLNEPLILDRELEEDKLNKQETKAQPLMGGIATESKPRLLWLEISPYRVIMTMQGNGKFSYRHLWEKGMYGISRYWLQGEGFQLPSQFRLRNFTRNLVLVGRSFPEHLRLEYELWSEKLPLGRYVLDLEIHP
jgi:hypothetical protein